MKIRILESARQDLLDGYCFYEKQADGIGTYFLESIVSDIDSLIDHAGIHPVYFGKYHRLLAANPSLSAIYLYDFKVKFGFSSPPWDHIGTKRSETPNRSDTNCAIPVASAEIHLP